MKQKYYVNNNAQTNGDHEVHVPTCVYFPSMNNKTYLGEFESCKEAVHEAKRHHHQVNGCKECCRPCHTT